MVNLTHVDVLPLLTKFG